MSLKASSRKTLATALSLGAVVFAWPVKALQCPLPPYSRDVLSLGQAPEAASAYARKRVAEMQSIFLGRIASAEYIPFTSRGGVFVITYEVSKWFKGNGGLHARIVWYPAIPCAENCPVEETILSLEADKTTAIVFAEPLNRDLQLNTGRSKNWDGENRPCGNPSPLPVAMEALPRRSSAEYDEVLFKNALRSEIKILKKGHHPNLSNPD